MSTVLPKRSSNESRRVRVHLACISHISLIRYYLDINSFRYVDFKLMYQYVSNYHKSLFVTTLLGTPHHPRLRLWRKWYNTSLFADPNLISQLIQLGVTSNEDCLKDVAAIKNGTPMPNVPNRNLTSKDVYFLLYTRYLWENYC